MNVQHAFAEFTEQVFALVSGVADKGKVVVGGVVTAVTVHLNIQFAALEVCVQCVLNFSAVEFVDWTVYPVAIVDDILITPASVKCVFTTHCCIVVCCGRRERYNNVM